MSSNQSRSSDDQPGTDTEPEKLGDAGQGSLTKITGFMSSPGVKFILIGIITIALLIPATMVWVLVEERADRANEVAVSIAQGWGNAQTVNGPYLVVPYRISERVNNTVKQVTRHAVISPEKLVVRGDIDVQERKKSIYKTQLYHLKSALSGKFQPVDLSKIENIGGMPNLDAAFLALGISDMTGFRSDVLVKLDGKSGKRAMPGLNRIQNNEHSAYYAARTKSVALRSSPNGIHLPLDRETATAGFNFELDIALNGSRDLTVVPAGSSTEYALQSNWPHPGFDGRFLPENRTITPDGFTANWTIPDLARGIDGMQLGDSLPGASASMKVNFVEPLKFYQITSRTLKYSIGFLSLAFLAVFILELTGRKAIHWIQYTLVGLAMVIFYILLLAFAEQVGFATAYLISSLATTGLVSWYIGDSFGHRRSALIMAAVLGLTYLVMYLILNEEDYALLAGSIIAFAAIAATMVATRRVDWTGGVRQSA